MSITNAQAERQATDAEAEHYKAAGIIAHFVALIHARMTNRQSQADLARAHLRRHGVAVHFAEECRR